MPGDTDQLRVLFLGSLSILVGFVLGIGLAVLWPAKPVANPPPAPQWVTVVATPPSDCQRYLDACLKLDPFCARRMP